MQFLAETRLGDVKTTEAPGLLRGRDTPEGERLEAGRVALVVPVVVDDDLVFLVVGIFGRKADHEAVRSVVELALEAVVATVPRREDLRRGRRVFLAHDRVLRVTHRSIGPAGT